MSNIWENFKWLWVNLLWVIAGIIVMIDPEKIYEWGHKHESWGGLIIAAFGAILAWALKHRARTPVDGGNGGLRNTSGQLRPPSGRAA